MALTPSTVTRTDDLTGDTFLTFDTGGGDKAQGVVVVDENGAHTGIPSNELVVSVANTVSVDDSTPIDVNVTATVFPTVTLVEYSTGATAEASAVIHNAAAELREIRVILDPSVTATRYLMLFDATSLPADGTVPEWRALVPPAGQMSESWPNGLSFSTGIVAAISTTLDDLTVSGAEAFFQAQRI